jgi:hypothetical protein
MPLRLDETCLTPTTRQSIMVRIEDHGRIHKNMTDKGPSVSNPRSREMTRHDEVSAT